MGDLRDKLIKLAHDNPELRVHLLPMIKDGAGEYDNRARAVIRHIRDKYGSGKVVGILQAGLEIMNK